MPSDPTVETVVCTCEPGGEVTGCPHFTIAPGVDFDCPACSWRDYSDHEDLEFESHKEGIDA